MTKYHAVMIDETGCEFGASVPDVPSRSAAYEWLSENYPESRCAQLESREDTARREAAMQYDIDHGIYRNEDGSIDFIEPGYEQYPDDDEEEEEYEADDDSYDEYPQEDVDLSYYED